MTENTLAELPALEAIMQRPLTDAEGQRALTLLMQASALFRVKAPWVDDRLADGTLSPTAVGVVVAGVVKRVFLNPTGSVSITTGPYSRTLQTRTGKGNNGDLAVTDEDVEKLIGSTQRGRPRSIKLVAALAPSYAIDRRGQLVEQGLAGYPGGLSGIPGAPE